MKHSVDAFVNLLETGKFLEAIDLYYHEDIIQKENYQASIKGKQRLRQIEMDNLDRVSEVSCKVLSYVVDEGKNLVMGEMYIEFTSINMGKMLLEEAFIQRWDEGKILYQRFYYKDFQHMNESTIFNISGR